MLTQFVHGHCAVSGSAEASAGPASQHRLLVTRILSRRTISVNQHWVQQQGTADMQTAAAKSARKPPCTLRTVCAVASANLATQPASLAIKCAHSAPDNIQACHKPSQTALNTAFSVYLPVLPTRQRLAEGAAEYNSRSTTGQEPGYTAAAGASTIDTAQEIGQRASIPLSSSYALSQLSKAASGTKPSAMQSAKKHPCSCTAAMPAAASSCNNPFGSLNPGPQDTQTLSPSAVQPASLLSSNSRRAVVAACHAAQIRPTLKGAVPNVTDALVAAGGDVCCHLSASTDQTSLASAIPAATTSLATASHLYASEISAPSGAWQPPSLEDAIKSLSNACNAKWTSSHAEVHKLLRRRGLIKQGAKVLVAVSGGQDSVALAKLLWDLSPKWNWTLGIIHCNHGWREDSGANAEYIRRLADAWGVPFHTAQPDAPVASEDAARNWRHDQYAEVVQQYGYDVVALGHTATDRAETLLMNLMRGSGMQGLQAMTWQKTFRRESGTFKVIRPLLDLTRQDTGAICNDLGLYVWEDSTNRDLSLRRNRVRLELMPYLEQHFNNKVQLNLSKAAAAMHHDQELLDQLTDKVMARCVTDRHVIHRRKLRQFHESLQRRVVMRVLENIAPAGVSSDVVDELVQLLTAPNKSRSGGIAGGFVATVVGHFVVVHERDRSLDDLVMFTTKLLEQHGDASTQVSSAALHVKADHSDLDSDIDISSAVWQSL